MKKSRYIYLTLCMAMLMASCGKDLRYFNDQGLIIEYEAVKSELDVSESSFSIDGSEQTLRIKISSNSYWTAKTNSQWLFLDNNNGTGNGTLTIKVYSNPSTTTDRTDGISVTDGIKTLTIVINQAPSTETIVLSKNSLSFKYSEDYSIITVTANSDWTVTSDASWCIAEKYYGDLGIAVYANNSFSPRTATVTVKGLAATATINVTQVAPQKPTMGDLQVTNITKTSADCQFTYNSSDLSIQRRGVCYSDTNKEPTTSDKTTSSYGTSYQSPFTQTLTELKQNTTYYVRSFVVTNVETTYGKTLSFTTKKSNSPNEGDNPPPNY